MFDEDSLIPISALQHVLYCKRQYALIHLEQLWDENRFTAEGRVLHERVDDRHKESRKDYKIEYGMSLRSLEYGLIGKADVVEFKKAGMEYLEILPVEFKRGRTKSDDWDNVQLCAQALCLEEMFSLPVEKGQFYYLQGHRRTDVLFSNELRQKTAETIDVIRKINAAGKTPAAVYASRLCDRCSIFNLCMPKATNRGGKGVSRYIAAQIRRVAAGDEE